MIEVIPSFENAPAQWIDRFDQSSRVLDRYDITTGQGIVQVLIEPKVKTVLNEIKKMPGRLVAGSRAQAFLINPFATLGDDAADVISEEKFVEACDAAGIRFERFFPYVSTRNQQFEIGLRIEAPCVQGDPVSSLELLTNQELEKFLRISKEALKKNYQLIFWNGFELEINQDTESHLGELEEALRQRLNPKPLVSYEDVHDLSRYSDRILDIGVEKPILSPYIAKLKKEDGWFPENLVQFVTYTPEGTDEESSVSVTRDSIEVIKVAIDTAEKNGKQSIRVSGVDCDIPVVDAKRIVETFRNVWAEIDRGVFKGDDELKPKEKREKQEKKTLLLHSNIDSLHLDEASCHMLAITKFIRSYVEDYNQRVGVLSPAYIQDAEKRKLDDFLVRFVNLLAQSKPDSYFYDCVFVGRRDLEEFVRGNGEMLRGISERADVLKRQADDLGLKMNEEFHRIFRD